MVLSKAIAVTAILVRTPAGRITGTARDAIARILSDAVLIPNISSFPCATRSRCQIHFIETAAGHMKIGGVLVSDQETDIIVIDIGVADSSWAKSVRQELVRGVLAGLGRVVLSAPRPPIWCVAFHPAPENAQTEHGNVDAYAAPSSTHAKMSENSHVSLMGLTRQLSPNTKLGASL